MEMQRGRIWISLGGAGLAASVLLGCGANVGTVTQPLHVAVQVSSFALPPVDVPAPALAVPQAAPVSGAVGTAADRAARVTVLGRALLKGASNVANVLDGQVIGSPIAIVDARSNQVLAKTVTYYDGSFTAEIEMLEAERPVIISTTLIDAADPTQRAPLAATAVLRPSELQPKVAVTPGSTALTMFLGALAATPTDRPGKTALVTEDIGLAPAGQPSLGSLILKLGEEQRASFQLMAETSADMQHVDSVATMRAGLSKFLGRVSVTSKP